MRGATDAFQQAADSYRLPEARRRIAEMEAELAGMKG